MYIHKTANIYTVSEYIFMNVILAFAIFMWYGVIGIKRLTIGKFALGYTETAYLFVVLILIFLFVGIGLTIKRFRTGLNVFVNVITPMELFVILSCFEFWKTHILVALGLGFVFSVLYLILFFIADRRKPARSRREARCRTNKAIVFSRNIAVITVVCIISGDLIGMNWGTVVGPDISPASAVNEPEEWSLIAHADTIAMLRQDIWDEISPKEQMNILQTVVNIETGYLGLPYEIHVAACSLGETILGEYDHTNRRILVNAEYLDQYTSLVYLDAILHEMRHAYQYACQDLYMQTDSSFKELPLFQDTVRCMEEMENYQTPEDGRDDYYTQFCESDARSYAESAIDKYKELIIYDGI